MHYQIHVEDQSGKMALDSLIPKIIEQGNTFEVYPYKGIGRIPKGMNDPEDASKRILLDSLPKLLQGAGETFRGYGENYQAVFILVCDLDRKCLKEFRKELLGILNKCKPKPETRFCIAIEEMEAWYLGDIKAIKEVYPKAKDAVLDDYINDSICGTWEKLADAIYNGGSKVLSAMHYTVIGIEKSKWAEAIAPLMDINKNNSPSFCYFRDKLKELA